MITIPNPVTVPVLIRNLNIGSSCNVHDEYVYIPETIWVDEEGIPWTDDSTDEVPWQD